MKKYRLGVDAGGTFTDFVLADQGGNLHLFKATSTPEDGTKAIPDATAWAGVPGEYVFPQKVIVPA